MSDTVELVIKIPKDVYEDVLKHSTEIQAEGYIIAGAVLYGTPLPKGHGRLKDIDKIISDGSSKGFCEWYDEMKYADTIIEADKEGEDGE